MGNIRLMPESLIGKIQAGEVVERPSSVVKELVENSIDAKAKDIKIYLSLGGLESIKIIDDGIGMDKDDVEASFLRHATSKIHNDYDLFRIKTLGFRGEAIASIKEVSKMTILSSTDGKLGYEVIYKYGKRISGESRHSNKGTTITVESLFLNTPARLKYLKSEKTELSSILFYIERLAMAHIDIRFIVYNNDKEVFQTSGSNNISNLIFEIYGKDASKKILETSYIMDFYKCHLVLIKPEIYRSNKLEITLVVNGRYVKNYNITNSTIEAFDTYLPIGKSPIAILYYDIDPLLVDPNVHPNKVEIKISNEIDICNELKKRIKSLLLESTLIPERNVDNYNKNIKYEKINIFEEINNKLEENINYNKEINNDNDYKIDYNKSYVNEIQDEYIKQNNEIKEEPIVFEETKKLPHLEYVGTLFGTYLIFENSEGMYLMDQHAAAERYNYEYYYEILSKPHSKTDLLVPFTITFSKRESLFIEENILKFSSIGFDLDLVGDNTYAIRSVPLWAKIDNFDDICYDILSKMIEENNVDIMYFRDHIAKMIACKASIKANHRLNKDEIDSLIKNLNTCKNPYTCPHGRPTLIKLTVSEIEKMFERIQK